MLPNKRMANVTGERFGRLVAIEYTGKKDSDNKSLWKCQCDCGNIHIVSINLLRRKNNNTRSCGCLKRELLSERSKSSEHLEMLNLHRSTHNMSKTKLYNIWCHIKQRCFNENNPDHKWYGRRGIGIFYRWCNFEPFKDWALSNGYQDGLTIHRKNPNDHYKPDNCIWLERNNHMKIDWTIRKGG